MQGQPVDKSTETWKDVVGDPDDKDRKNIQILIKNFSKEKFKECQVYDMDCDQKTCKHKPTILGQHWIGWCMAATKRDTHLDTKTNPYAIKNKEAESRLLTSLPTVLFARIGNTMPTVFREKSHMEWFVKNFKSFLLPKKI